MAVTHTSSQQLWLLAQDLYKIKLVKNASIEVQGTPDAIAEVPMTIADC